MRPPYWKVFFRFCSHALAMPVRMHIVTSPAAWPMTFIHSVIVCVRVFTLILCCGAEGGLLQVFEQEGFEDLRAAVEGSQDVEQPPAPLATITARREGARIHPGLQAWVRERSECVCVGLGCGVNTSNVFKATYGLELVLAVSCLSSWQ